ncbi:hypothetical protein PIB30_015885 [Stylosanthes scabra]|uniref:DUF4408 domain-containing protein n=1 Tax=Stylosanthes scabra TaxID=79078 RepID=A0ABU6T956_9FABA|nr:hypothetical protein [Stylosanthes scabra]
MFEESLSSSTSSATFWSSLTSWFTPTIFFLLLQLVIATIYIISSLSNHNNAKHEHHDPPHETNFHFQQQPLARSPSLLHRLKSLNFYNYHEQHQLPHDEINNCLFHQQEQQQQQPLARSPSLLQRLKSINLYSYYPHHHHTSQEPQQPPQQPPQQLSRSPSSVLQRLKSINLQTYFPTESFSSYFTPDKTVEQQPPKQPKKKTHVPKIPPVQKPKLKKSEPPQEQEYEDDDVVGEMMFRNNNNNSVHHNHNHDDVDEDSCASMDEIFSKLQQGQNGNFTRTHSDTKPASGEVPVKLPKKMKKSASTKSAFSHFQEVDIVETRRPATAKDGGAAAEEGVGDGGVDAKCDDFINRFKQQLKLQRLDSIMRYKDMIGRGTAK